MRIVFLPNVIISGAFFLLLITGCAKSYVNEKTINNGKLKSINILKHECYEHNLNSCYKAGNYYTQQSETNTSAIKKALNFYNLGCEQIYDAGFITRKIKIVRDKKSCLEEAKILKNIKSLSKIDGLLASAKLKKVAKYYYEQGDFLQSKDYYLASLSWYEDENIYYILSQMALKGEGSKIDYKLSKEYYLLYYSHAFGFNYPTRHMLKNYIRSQLKTSSLTIKWKMRLLQDGTVDNVSLTTPLKDNSLNEKILNQIKKKTYHPIPVEYNIKEISLPVVYFITL